MHGLTHLLALVYMGVCLGAASALCEHSIITQSLTLYGLYGGS